VNVRARPTSSALLLAAAIAAGGLGGASPAAAQRPEPPSRQDAATREVPVARPVLDRSGRKRVGTASVYAHRFVGRKMADGGRMQADGDNAASKTLPLGTKAEVTNLETGQSATVTIQDRGPYVKGRIVDLSPGTADKIGITPKEGVAKVEVKPLSLPPAEREANY